MQQKEVSSYSSGIHITGETIIRRNQTASPYSYDLFQSSDDEVALSVCNLLFLPEARTSLLQVFRVREKERITVGKRYVTHPGGNARGFLAELASRPGAEIEQSMVRALLGASV